MKIFCLILLTGMACFRVQAEEEKSELDVFAAEVSIISVPSNCLVDVPAKLPSSLKLMTIKKGVRLGSIAVKPGKLAAAHEKAKKYNASQDPIIGEGQHLVVAERKEKNVTVYYSVYVETEPKIIVGKRFVIGLLTPLDDRLFVGSTHDGVSINQEISRVLYLILSKNMDVLAKP